MTRTRRKAATFRDLDPKRLRHHRRALGFTREDFAAYFRTRGFRWTDRTVRDLENGDRELSRMEWLYVLQTFGGERGFYGDDSPPFETPSPGSVLELGEIEEIVAGRRTPEVDEDALRRWRELNDVSEHGEAERKAARTLRVDVVELKKAARTLWRKSLLRERERLLTAELERRGDVDARTTQALRGHIMRKLLKELRAELDRRKAR